MIRLGLVGLGKIARDQHLPAIARTDGIELVAVASPHAVADVPVYHDIEAMLASETQLDAVVLCQPPQLRFDAAMAALRAGKHVFLEKPPGVTLSEVEALIQSAGTADRTLFAAWHSREGAGVAKARAWLADRSVKAARIEWKEDVRVWHPGQHWIWEPGGFGVFDPGINALSILTAVLPEPVRVTGAVLDTPANRAAPIAARLDMATASGQPVVAEFDFLQTGPQKWNIAVDTDAGELMLREGGNRLFIDGEEVETGGEREYPALYDRFVTLVREGRSDVDIAPLRIVADAFLCGRGRTVDPFHEDG
ncbi:Gfo/Idh/MocA family oxidoreductase [uncultured Croceicoccus sp.]|uniref:Gfo/Idh/MocA family protein n=1 Tax=uncultured Croceicoccus sp. TaxID=1295329 RepID=UPI0026320A5B|nr:Gfo/Idh/MocA family oxidoreductase [uncultured Croceicoccus sp.]